MTFQGDPNRPPPQDDPNQPLRDPIVEDRGFSILPILAAAALVLVLGYLFLGPSGDQVTTLRRAEHAHRAAGRAAAGDHHGPLSDDDAGREDFAQLRVLTYWMEIPPSTAGFLWDSKKSSRGRVLLAHMGS